jgi:hypothetical protein
MPRKIMLTMYPLYPDTEYYDDSVGKCRPKSVEAGRIQAIEAMESGEYEYCSLSWLDDDGKWQHENFNHEEV